MNVEIGAEAALFPEKEYINGIAVTVRENTYMTLGVWDLVHPTSSSLSMLILKLVGGRGFVVKVFVTGSDSTCQKY